MHYFFLTIIFLGFTSIQNELTEVNEDYLNDYKLEIKSNQSNNNLTIIQKDSRVFKLKFKNDAISNTDLLVPSVRLPCRRFSCRFGNCENILIDEKLNHTCHCFKGISGPKCDSLDNEKLPCSSNPCYAGAKCYNYKDDYMCDCPPGREGKNCNKSSIQALDPCRSNPCGYDGICYSATNGYWCFCNNGKQGKNCLNLEDQPVMAQYCTSDTCLNGGRCLGMNNSILCSCKKNYFGPKCEYLSNNFKTRESCLNNVCKNAGTCILKNGKTECICKNFYTGKFCESSVYKQCGDGICNSLHGVCIMDSCYCFKGYKGYQCQTKIDMTIQI